MDFILNKKLEDYMKRFGSQMREHEEKLQLATSGSNTAHSDISSLAHDFALFKTFVWQTLSMLKIQIELLSLGQDRQETAMRRKVLLFHGVPETKDEKLHEVVAKVLSDQMQLTDISGNDLQVCHRLGATEGKLRPVLVRFQNLEHRHLVWDNKTSLKGSGITVSEFLTKLRHQVFVAARKHFGMKNCWSSEGKIVVSLPDKSRRKVEVMAELQPLIDKYPGESAVEVTEASKPAKPLSGVPDKREAPQLPETPRSSAPKKSPKKTRRR